MNKLFLAGTAALAPLVAFAQEAERQNSFVTALITWLPLLFLIVLWVLFFRRIPGKGGYREYMRVSQERIERIEGHLADIAVSLRKIAESNDRPK